MKLLARRSARAEDRFEKWIRQRHQERVLSGETQSTGACPNEAFLRGLARRSKKIPLSDPRIDHAANCPVCMTRILAIRSEYRSRQRTLTYALGTIGCLFVVAGLFVWSHYREHRRQTLAAAAPVSETVDLLNADTTRGQQLSRLQSVVLPATAVHLTIILPRFSLPGQYLVAVTRDQSGNGVIAEGLAPAATIKGQVRLSVSLDLRKAKPGAYFLSTTHEQDQAAYYYPLQIK